MKNIKFLIAVMLSVTVSMYSSYVHATTKQGNEQLEKPKKTVRIVVGQSYKDRTSPVEGISLPFKSIAQRLLEYANLMIVAPETKDYDYMLKIQAHGEALGAQYNVLGSAIYYYTGASLKGTISLEGAGVSTHDISFSGKISPPKKIDTKHAPTSPSDAPFYKAFDSSGFESKIAKMLGEVYGVQFLVNAQKDEDGDVRADARKELEEMGTAAVEPLIAALNTEDADVRRIAAQVLGKLKDPRAVEPLIRALNDEDGYVWKATVDALVEIKDPRAVEPLITTLRDARVFVRINAVKALKKITGQSVGEDYEAWSKWWQEQKEKK